ncbi:MAG TPA: hypothetical protein VL547_08270 [Dinghuibacter sp.]|uniref:hypothetical protein n=1 Tax=Dinghuibacter sp. TaxID=2024697 RepID=UPI002C49E56D|nr:hypothetical protein [Dinghuibacter sp.]HTJ12005.1 hypothetical protein [Dinghuibacter sp.]
MLRKQSKVLLIGLGILAAFDLLVEIPFLKAALSEDTVMWLTLLVYFGIAYEGARRGGVRWALRFVVVACIFDWLFTPGIEWVLRTATAPFNAADWALALALIYLPYSVVAGLLAALVVRLSVKKTE